MSERNLVVLRGSLVSEPRRRELPSGSGLVQFDITTRDDAGSVRRRFFRAGGVTQSHTEVVAEHVVAASRSRSVRRVLGAATRALERADA